MPIATLILAGAMGIAPKMPVEVTVDFSQVTTGINYRIVIKLFDSKGRQRGNTQTIDVGAAAGHDSNIRGFQTAIHNLGLAATPVAGTKKVKITGAAADFRRIEYTTFSRKGANWVPRPDIKGPTPVGKPGAHAPTFVVNPKPL